MKSESNPIFTRVSVRKFKKQKVEKEKIDLILKAAMASPSARNQQPWRFYITDKPDILEKLSTVHQYAKPIKGAPLAFILAYDTDKLISPDYAQIDMAICSENIMLEAAALGLGSVYISACPRKERMENMNKIMNFAKNIVPFVIIPIGYPSFETKQENRYDEKKVFYI